MDIIKKYHDKKWTLYFLFLEDLYNSIDELRWLMNTRSRSAAFFGSEQSPDHNC
jgi:hypothetical protein